MSRDPLEGYRPNDTAAPSFAPAPAGSFGSPVAAQAVVSPRGPRTTIIVLVIVGTAFAVVAGVVAYFQTLPHAPLAPKAKPTGEVIVKQGPAPADQPSPAPIATPK